MWDYIGLIIRKRAMKHIMKVLFLLCISCIVSWSASFDCAKAATKIEKAICADSRLGELDEELAHLYKGLLKSLDAKGKEVLRREQRYWLKDRNRRFASANVDSLLSSYEQRISALAFGYQDLSYFNGNYEIPHEISVLTGEDWERSEATDDFCFQFISMDSIRFTLETITTNAHTCTVGGVAVRNKKGIYEWRSEPGYDDKVCVLHLYAGDGHLIFEQANESGGCRDFCGARASIDFYTFTLKQRVDKKPCEDYDDLP